jgi:hypothetical protein
MPLPSPPMLPYLRRPLSVPPALVLVLQLLLQSRIRKASIRKASIRKASIRKASIRKASPDCADRVLLREEGIR